MGKAQSLIKRKSSVYSTKLIIGVFLLLFVLVLFRTETSPFKSSSSPSAASWVFFEKWRGMVLGTNQVRNPSNITNTLASKLRDSVTFLPLKDLRFAETAMTGNAWFMSSLNDTYEKNEAEHLYFPSQTSKGRLLCINGQLCRWLRKFTLAMKIYGMGCALWLHLLVGPSKNGCLRPTRWVLFHWGELRHRMGSWLQNLMQASFREFPVEELKNGDGPYCFERAVVMRHNLGSMGKEKRLQGFDLLRCKARGFCSINPVGREREVNEKGEPIIRVTFLMRRGSRSFKNATAVIDIFARECARVEGCLLKVAQSEDLSFWAQFCLLFFVRVMSYTDIVASPHGAQLTNMLFMYRSSSIMEFFPKGWLEHAGIGPYAHHWMTDLSGMKHQGAWWEPIGEKQCPFPQQGPSCFDFYKNGRVGHNETFFAEWTRTVLKQVRLSKLDEATKIAPLKSSACLC
ncbi:hypothetical protein I3843_07G166800 [Carya illinoinensis]|nr:hypothetical protein I3843_07G166800 [Carya illinoinensis]